MQSRVSKLKKHALGVVRGGVEGRKRNFHNISNEKINKMMQMEYQVRSEVKIKWAVKAFREWRAMRLDRKCCEKEILHCDLDDIATVTKENLEHSLCRFIVEVKKSSSDEDYPGRTLYQMSCAIQNHLKKCGLNWKLVHGNEFESFNRVLDKVMQE